jgi:hypothetical protein
VRERFAREMARLSSVYSSALWAMERQFKKVDSRVSEQIYALRQEFKKESGIVARTLPAVLGPVLVRTTRQRKAARERKNVRAANNYGAQQLGRSIDRRRICRESDFAQRCVICITALGDLEMRPPLADLVSTD